MVHTAAVLVLLRLGVFHAKACSMFQTIQKMIHRVRTAFGDSELTYGGDDLDLLENPPQGFVQGNASGPAIWSIISSVIFACLHSRGHSVFFCSAISKQLFALVGFMYVDDCSLFQCGSDPQVVLDSMQEVLISWGSLVEVTGGTISIDKCWWYLVDFVWSRGKWVATDVFPEGDLVAYDEQGSAVSLKRLCCSEASEMLGLWMAPNGSTSRLLNSLRVKL